MLLAVYNLSLTSFQIVVYTIGLDDLKYKCPIVYSFDFWIEGAMANLVDNT